RGRRHLLPADRAGRPAARRGQRAADAGHGRLGLHLSPWLDQGLVRAGRRGCTAVAGRARPAARAVGVARTRPQATSGNIRATTAPSGPPYPCCIAWSAPVREYPDALRPSGLHAIAAPPLAAPGPPH